MLKRILIAILIVFGLGMLNPLLAIAQQKDADKKKTSINFEDELIQGDVKKPELLYLLQKKQFNFKRLIKLRENFLPEMRTTADEIQRGRGED